MWLSLLIVVSWLRVNLGCLIAGEEERTLIIARRILMEPNTALAGAIHKASFARFKLR